jgi:transcriptional regulator with XRE-family HTH domain
MARKIEHIDLIDKHIGNKIQELRLASGLSRQQLGEKIEVTHQQLQKYEKGTNRVSAGRLAIIAKFLKRPIQYFYDGIATDETEADEAVDFTNHQRMCIEVSRNFMRIRKAEHKDAVNSLVRTLANSEETTQ